MIALLCYFLALVSESQVDARQEIAHRACEVTIYSLLAPRAADNAVNVGAEMLVVPLCRHWSL